MFCFKVLLRTRGNSSSEGQKELSSSTVTMKKGNEAELPASGMKNSWLDEQTNSNSRKKTMIFDGRVH
jgi:hypothetical protein